MIHPSRFDGSYTVWFTFSVLLLNSTMIAIGVPNLVSSLPLWTRQRAQALWMVKETVLASLGSRERSFCLASVIVVYFGKEPRLSENPRLFVLSWPPWPPPHPLLTATSASRPTSQTMRKRQ
jgi:hypothetical protein